MRSLPLALGWACLLLAAPFPGNSETHSRKSGKANKGVDLNTGSEAELESVPGIGKERALRIIAGRPYSSIRDLKVKAGFTSQDLLAVSPLVKVSAPAPAAIAAPVKALSHDSNGESPPGDSTRVWVNLDTKVFHNPGDKYYGKTRRGVYMSESDALSAGYRAAKTK